AKTIVDEYDGQLPRDPSSLQGLPGIGKYSARAILIFAFNAPLVTVDTNIRRVILHELSLPTSLSDADLYHAAEQLMPRGRARDWHYALMDYSSLALPKQIAAIPPRTRQSRFEGSVRQIRGAIVRHLTRQKSVSCKVIAQQLDRPVEAVSAAAEAMAREGLVVVARGRIVLCD
ncbi:Fe-S cluster assembly protein HesB, partial [candidate division GN15 bacterium]|nr:Fe-S cluster assembly protein HesB [candidate division GN15 bacterium]